MQFGPDPDAGRGPDPAELPLQVCYRRSSEPGAAGPTSGGVQGTLPARQLQVGNIYLNIV